MYVLLALKVRIPLLRKKNRDTFFSPTETEDGKKVLMYKTITKNKISMASVKEKIAYALGDAAAGIVV